MKNCRRNFVKKKKSKIVKRISRERCQGSRDFKLQDYSLVLEWRATHVENFWFQNCNISSVLSVFKYNPGKTNSKLICNLLSNLLSNFLVLIINTSIINTKKLLRIRFGHSLWSANQLPAQEGIEDLITKKIFQST